MGRDPNRRPTHPGELLREDVLPELGITQTELAQRLGVSRVTVSELVNEHRALSADMAVRFEKLLGASAEMWLGMQQAVDLWDARNRTRLVQPAAPQEVHAEAVAVWRLDGIPTQAVHYSSTVLKRLGPAKVSVQSSAVTAANDFLVRIQQKAAATTLLQRIEKFGEGLTT